MNYLLLESGDALLTEASGFILLDDETLNLTLTTSFGQIGLGLGLQL